MRGVTESMAGRAAIFQLLPLALQETTLVSPLRGGFPEVLARPRASPVWFRSYVQTYLERDVRAVSSIRDLAQFRRFLALLAARHGQVLNKTDLAAPLGVSVPTVTEWLGILEITAQVLIVPPYFESFGKRLVKSPKVYFADSGLVCHLLGIDSDASLRRSPFAGPVFEGFVAAEIAKTQIGRGRPREFYYFRDQQGLEVDFVVPQGGGRLALIEARSSRTPRPDDAAPLVRLGKAIGGHDLNKYVVHPRVEGGLIGGGLAPEVKAVAVDDLWRVLGGGAGSRGPRAARGQSR
jgi:predicted AAA+ superfamily ATPase